MRLYKTSKGIVISKGEKLYLVQNDNWDGFVNDDNLTEKIEKLTLVLKARNDIDLENVQAPIGNHQAGMQAHWA